MDRADAHFVEVGGYTQPVYHPAVPAVPEVPADYPTLRAATDQADPGLTHTTAIANVTDLQNMNNDLAGNYYLTGNIDASATSAWNGGAGFAPINSWFTGTLDGCGYTITGLTINRPTTYYCGLFSQMRAAARVANLTLANINYTVGADSGGLVGHCNEFGVPTPKIYNCHTTGTIAVTSCIEARRIGGMIGSINIVVTNSPVEIYDCTSSVDVTVTATVDTQPQGIGGFLGQESGNVACYNCSASGDVSETANGTTNGNGIGGFVGWLGTYSTIYQDCSATGDVSGDDYVGGFVGQSGAAHFTRCSATGKATAIDPIGEAGGFAGRAANSSYFTDCYAWGRAYGGATGYAAGFSGISFNSVNYDNCYSIGIPVAGTTAGFTGNAGGGVVSNVYWDTEASGQATDPLATGRDTASMKTQTDYAGTWDFDTVWDMGYVAAIPGTDEYWTETDIGYSHLIGETISILADGVVQEDQVVSDTGTIDETAFADATNVHVGLAYESTLMPMRPVLVSGQKTSMVDNADVKTMGISVHNTDGIKYGVENDMHEVNFAHPILKNRCEIDGLYTGLMVVNLEGGYNKESRFQVSTDQPLPAVVRALIPNVEFYG